MKKWLFWSLAIILAGWGALPGLRTADAEGITTRGGGRQCQNQHSALDSGDPEQEAEYRRLGRMITQLLPHLKGVDLALDFPVYYINMDKDEGRRQKMVCTWGDVWDLRRHAGVNVAEQGEQLLGKKHMKEVMEHIQVNSKGDDRWFRVRRAQVGLVLAHLTAIKRAYEEGLAMAMIAEDDLTPYMVPYWRRSLRDVVGLVEEKEDWHVLQLSHVDSRIHDDVHGGWGFVSSLKAKEVQPDFAKAAATRLGGYVVKGRFRHGTAAYIISRRGMKHIVDKYFSAKTGLIQLPILEEWIRIDDEILPQEPGIYVALPSMFTTDFDTPSTIGSTNHIHRLVHQNSLSEAISMLTASASLSSSQDLSNSR